MASLPPQLIVSSNSLQQELMDHKNVGATISEAKGDVIMQDHSKPANREEDWIQTADESTGKESRKQRRGKARVAARERRKSLRDKKPANIQKKALKQQKKRQKKTKKSPEQLVSGKFIERDAPRVDLLTIELERLAVGTSTMLKLADHPAVDVKPHMLPTILQCLGGLTFDKHIDITMKSKMHSKGTVMSRSTRRHLQEAVAALLGEVGKGGVVTCVERTLLLAINCCLKFESKYEGMQGQKGDASPFYSRVASALLHVFRDLPNDTFKISELEVCRYLIRAGSLKLVVEATMEARRKFLSEASKSLPGFRAFGAAGSLAQLSELEKELQAAVDKWIAVTDRKGCALTGCTNNNEIDLKMEIE